MPPLKDVDSDETWDVVAYLLSVAGPPPTREGAEAAAVPFDGAQ